MRWRAVALISFGVNLCLAAAWLIASRERSAELLAKITTASAHEGITTTNVVVRRQFFTWQEVESPDYPTYIANLRDIGCPEQTIRDIIIADVNGMFARRRATELVTPEQQWWRSTPDTNVLQAALERARSLEEERRGLLARLLGTNWESGDMASLPRPSRPGVVLDGPVLGVLPADTKLALQEINERSEERLQTYLRGLSQAGRSADPVELARMRQQTRDELARVLGPAPLEEYLLRYSQNATELRTELGQLEYFNATPEEFRAVFRSTDTLDSQIQLLSGNDPNTISQRRALESARENAIRVALGPKRYEDYRMLHDPLYREAVAEAEQAGTPEAARTIYMVNLAAEAEQASIGSDTNLTATQKNVALKQLELEQMTANALAAGQEPQPPQPPVPTGPPRRTYTVHPGDDLSVIAMIYGVPPNAIRQMNPKVNFNRLRPGDTVLLPPRVMTPGSAP